VPSLAPMTPATLPPAEAATLPLATLPPLPAVVPPIISPADPIATPATLPQEPAARVELPKLATAQLPPVTPSQPVVQTKPVPQPTIATPAKSPFDVAIDSQRQAPWVKNDANPTFPGKVAMERRPTDNPFEESEASPQPKMPIPTENHGAMRLRQLPVKNARQTLPPVAGSPRGSLTLPVVAAAEPKTTDELVPSPAIHGSGIIPGPVAPPPMAMPIVPGTPIAVTPITPAPVNTAPNPFAAAPPVAMPNAPVPTVPTQTMTPANSIAPTPVTSPPLPQALPVATVAAAPVAPIPAPVVPSPATSTKTRIEKVEDDVVAQKPTPAEEVEDEADTVVKKAPSVMPSRPMPPVIIPMYMPDRPMAVRPMPAGFNRTLTSQTTMPVPMAMMPIASLPMATTTMPTSAMAAQPVVRRKPNPAGFDRTMTSMGLSPAFMEQPTYVMPAGMPQTVIRHVALPPRSVNVDSMVEVREPVAMSATPNPVVMRKTGPIFDRTLTSFGTRPTSAILAATPSATAAATPIPVPPTYNSTPMNPSQAVALVQHPPAEPQRVASTTDRPIAAAPGSSHGQTQKTSIVDWIKERNGPTTNSVVSSPVVPAPTSSNVQFDPRFTAPVVSMPPKTAQADSSIPKSLDPAPSTAASAPLIAPPVTSPVAPNLMVRHETTQPTVAKQAEAIVPIPATEQPKVSPPVIVNSQCDTCQTNVCAPTMTPPPGIVKSFPSVSSNTPETIVIISEETVIAPPKSDVAKSDSTQSERIVTVGVNGKKMSCKVIEDWLPGDGRKALLVKSLETGELITVVREPAPAGAGGAMPARVFLWTDAKTSPEGAPMPPSYSLASQPAAGKAEPLAEVPAIAPIPTVEPNHPTIKADALVQSNAPARRVASDGLLKQATASVPANAAMDRPAMVVAGSREDQRTMTRCLQVLKDSPHPTEREEAVVELSKFDARLHPHIAESIVHTATTDKAATVRTAAVRALSAMHAPAHALAATVDALRNDSDIRVRDAVNAIADRSGDQR
jgi:hypothetical protein